MIPYYLSSSFSENDKNKIRRAVKELSDWVDCIDILEIREADASRYTRKIHVYPGRGCWSYLGMIRANKQDLSLGRGCVTTGVIQHEFIHALGKKLGFYIFPNFL